MEEGAYSAWVGQFQKMRGEVVVHATTFPQHHVASLGPDSYDHGVLNIGLVDAASS